MQAPEPVPIVAPGPRVVSRDLQLRKYSEGVDLVVRWRFDADEPGWFDAPLIGADVLVTSLSWNGRAVGLSPSDGPMRAVTLWVDGPGELVLRGVREARVAPGEGPLLPMLAAPHGTARAPADWVFASDGMAPVGGGRWWGGTHEVAVVGRQAVASARGALLGATVATGITVDDGAVQVAARLHVTALRGGIDEVVFTVPGAGPDLSVEGPQVASFERQGDRVTVALREADASTARLEVRWSASTPGGATVSVAAPSLVPQGMIRTAYVTKLARAGDREVVPEGDGWRAVALAELPDWSDGLLAGTATGALSYSGTGRGPASLTLQLLRFEPVAGPKTLIDTAQTAVALSDEGRMLMRTHLQVRNDRGATLRVTPPPGVRIVGVSVAGELPEPLVDGRSWRLPLKKSVETVDGLLSFPVRIVMVGDAPAFDGRTRDQLALPTFDADIAVHRVSVNLPMGHESRLKHDEKHVVASFTEGSGITYGFAVGDARATEADVLFQSAVSQWMSNDFDDAQRSLDQLRGFGAGSEDMDRLQSNLDLLFTESEEKESATSRRVKEQAKYRSIEESREQSRLLAEAEQALLEGDYKVAESNYAQALDIGGKLAKLDAGEDKSNAFKNEVVEKKLASTSTLSKQKKKAVDDATRGAREAEERLRQAQAREQAQADATKQAEAESARRWAEEDHRRAEAEAAERAHREAAAAAHAAAEQARYAAEASVEEPSAVVKVTAQRIIISDGEVPANAPAVVGMDFSGVEITGTLLPPDTGAVAAPPPGEAPASASAAATESESESCR